MLYEKGCEPYWLKRRVRFDPIIFGCLSGLSGDQIAYATQASEAAFIVLPEQIKAEILRENFRHTDENLYIAFDNDNAVLLQKYFGTIKEYRILAVDVEFEVKHLYFNNLHRAVEGLSQEVIATKVMPKAEDFIKISHCQPPNFLADFLKLHSYPRDQLKALQVITSCPAITPPILITGAFGTGKTRLLASAAYCILEHGQKSKQAVQVLVCAHHQASADAFLECYLELADPQHPWSVHLTRLTPPSYYIKNQSHANWYKTVRDFQSEVKYYCEYRQLLIVTTYLTSLRLSQMLPQGFFTHIFVDEGAQAREPELVAPLALATKDTRIVIAGDKCQVS